MRSVAWRFDRLPGRLVVTTLKIYGYVTLTALYPLNKVL